MDRFVRFGLMRRLNLRMMSSESRFDNRAVCHRLFNRQLISVEGNESSTLLQGLITNDIQLLQNDHTESPSLTRIMYTMMLNPQGRVLFDVLIYPTHHTKGPSLGNGFLVECDSSLTSNLLKHLNVFKMRKKLEICVRDDLKLWTIFRKFEEQDYQAMNLKSSIICSSNFIDCSSLSANVSADWYVLSRDPRQTSLGYRMILTDQKTPNDVLNVVDLNEADEVDYQILRYKLGIGEGAVDHPPGNCFPLECNADYLHGVNFHKGCYLGQELTARTHHTGVVRKRLLPIHFEANEKIVQNAQLDASAIIINEEEKHLGKLRGRIGDCGLALLRIDPCLHSSTRIYVKTVNNDVYPVLCLRPFWWPQETSNAKVSNQ